MPNAVTRAAVAQLRREHERLERRCEALLCLRADTADFARLQADWCALSIEIEECFAFEETTLLAGVAALGLSQRQHVGRVEAVHAAVRALLADIGDQIARRAVRPAAIEVLVELWCAHGALEATWILPWVALDERAAAATNLRLSAAA